MHRCHVCFFFFQAEDGIRDYKVTGVQTCALPILQRRLRRAGISQFRGSSPETRPTLRAVCARNKALFLLWPFLIAFRVLLLIRSEEHTSELQSPCNLVCRLLLEKKKAASSRVAYA